MSPQLALALIAATLNTAAAATLFALSRARGWRHLGTFALVAISAALYSIMDVISNVWMQTPTGVVLILRIQLVNGALHAASWLVYSFCTVPLSWRTMPRALRYAIPTLLGSALFVVFVTPVASGPMRAIDVSVLNTTQLFQPMSTWTLITLVPTFAALLTAFTVQFRKWRAGVPGAGYVSLGFAIFLACSAEEVLVAATIVPFIFLADVAFLAIVLPVAVQSISRVRRDADLLAELSEELAGAVEQRTAERDAAQSQLVEQERLAALGRFADGVGHEVNNPLAYVGANLELLCDELAESPSPTVASALADATDGVRRIRDVVASLRTYARPAADSFTVVELTDVMRDAARVARAAAPAGTTIQVVDGVQSVRAFGDAGRLVQVAVNLIVNGAQAAMANAAVRPPVVRVSVSHGPDDWAELHVVDSGGGFDPATLARMGEPYVTTRAADGGSGLGLFVSRGILDAHDGSLVVIADHAGGTRVVARLPELGAAERAQQEGAERSPFTLRRRRRTDTPSGRILLVDDEPMVVGALARALRRHGFEVDAYTSASDALAAVGDGSRHKVIVTDLMMPGMDGVAFAEALQAIAPALRSSLIVVTGGATTDHARTFTDRADVVLVPKPVDLSQLVGAIEAVLRRSD